MTSDVVNVLVIEDDPVDFKLLDMTLRGSSEYRLHCVGTAAQGEQALLDTDCDLVLLDLSLPDSDGLDTVEKLVANASCAVVILSGINDEDVALQAVKLGAQDYLVKGQFNTILLTKTLRYSIERYRLINELSISKQEIQRERELRRLRTSIDAVPESILPLRQGFNDAFEHSVEQYGAVVLRALDQRIYKTEVNLSEPLKQLAAQLGSRNALASDIVDIHNFTLHPMLNNLNANIAQVCNEEARYLLTGLFGHLCSYYQNFSNNLPTPVPLEPVIGASQYSPAFFR